MDYTTLSTETLAQQHQSTRESLAKQADKVFQAALPTTVVTPEMLTTDPTTLNVGDLFIAYETESAHNSRRWYGNPARRAVGEPLNEVASTYGWRMYVVVKKAAKTVEVVQVYRPDAYRAVDEDVREAAFVNQMRFGNSAYRHLLSLGVTYDEYLATVATTSAFARWERLFKAAEAMSNETDRRVEEAQKRVDAKVAPMKKVVETINKALGYRVADLQGETVYPGYLERGQVGEPTYSWAWGNMAKLSVAHHTEVLYGRAAMGKITEKQRDEAVKALKAFARKAGKRDV